MAPTPNDTYTRLLFAEGQGLPLWEPSLDANSPLEYQQAGIQVGDVGYYSRDGRFITLFNIARPKEDPINAWRGNLPDDFVPIKMEKPDHRPNAYPARSLFLYTNVGKATLEGLLEANIPKTPATVGASYRQHSYHSHAAALALTKGGSNINYDPDLSWWAIENSRFCYEYAAQLGYAIPNGGVYLVTGVTKTDNWHIWSFSEASGGNFASFKVSVAGVLGVGVEGSQTMHESGLHPPRCSPPDHDRPNQTIFIRGWKIMLSESLWRMTEADRKARLVNLQDSHFNKVGKLGAVVYQPEGNSQTRERHQTEPSNVTSSSLSMRIPGGVLPKPTTIWGRLRSRCWSAFRRLIPRRWRRKQGRRDMTGGSQAGDPSFSGDQPSSDGRRGRPGLRGVGKGRPSGSRDGPNDDGEPGDGNGHSSGGPGSGGSPSFGGTGPRPDDDGGGGVGGSGGGRGGSANSEGINGIRNTNGRNERRGSVANHEQETTSKRQGKARDTDLAPPNSNSEKEFSSAEDKIFPYHPSDVINTYLLDKYPSCDVVLTHDSTWCSVLRPEDEGMPSNEELLARVRSMYGVQESEESSAGRQVKSVMFKEQSNQSHADEVMHKLEALERDHCAENAQAFAKPDDEEGKKFTSRFQVQKEDSVKNVDRKDSVKPPSARNDPCDVDELPFDGLQEDLLTELAPVLQEEDTTENIDNAIELSSPKLKGDEDLMKPPSTHSTLRLQNENTVETDIVGTDTVENDIIENDDNSVTPPSTKGEPYDVEELSPPSPMHYFHSYPSEGDPTDLNVDDSESVKQLAKGVYYDIEQFPLNYLQEDLDKRQSPRFGPRFLGGYPLGDVQGSARRRVSPGDVSCDTEFRAESSFFSYPPTVFEPRSSEGVPSYTAFDVAGVRFPHPSLVDGDPHDKKKHSDDDDKKDPEMKPVFGLPKDRSPIAKIEDSGKPPLAKSDPFEVVSRDERDKEERFARKLKDEQEYQKKKADDLDARLARKKREFEGIPAEPLYNALV